MAKDAQKEIISSWPPPADEQVERISSWPPPADEQKESISSWPPDDKNGEIDKVLHRNEDVILPDIEEGTEFHEVDARTALAIWFRRHGKVVSLDLPEGLGPHSKINFIASSAQGKLFLKEKFSNLESLSRKFNKYSQYYYILATYADLLQLKNKAYEFSKKSLKILGLSEDFLESSNLKDYLDMIAKFDERRRNIVWLFCKLKMEQDLLSASKNTADTENERDLEVDRINCEDLSVEKFQENYCNNQKPVVITGLKDVITGPEWTLEHIRKVCGEKQVCLKSATQYSTGWAGLENQPTTQVQDFLSTSLPDDLYLFDWSLPLNAPELAGHLNLPQYFKENLLTSTSPGALYRESWPSLFVGAKGTGSGLHVDAFGSHFYMFLISGKKRWTFYPASSLAHLDPVFWDSLDPAFPSAAPRDTPCFTVDLCPGEILFVPAGSPHTVLNLEDSVAVSGNFVNRGNKNLFMKHIKINSLKDPRSRDLLQELIQLNLIK